MRYFEEIKDQALTWLKELIQIESVNPPGREKAAAEYVRALLLRHGIEPILLAKDPQRPNVFAQAQTPGAEGAILLSSHLDVVPAADPTLWKFPPFSATEDSGFIWGRGAVDMKYKTVFDIATLLWAKSQKLKKNVKFIALVDEEVECEFGSEYVCAAHRALIDSDYVFNEVGGYNVTIGARDFVLIQCGEKSVCQIRILATGTSAHASVEYEDNCILSLCQALAVLRAHFDGYTLIPIVQEFFTEVAKEQPEPLAQLFRALCMKQHYRHALTQIPEPGLRAQLSSMLTNTLNPTLIRGGFKINVIPDSVSADCNCRLLPGQDPQKFIQELREVLLQHAPAIAEKISFEILSYYPGYSAIPQGQVSDVVAATVEARWKDLLNSPKAIPYLLTASSDSSHYAHAGIVPIGFAPILSPAGYNPFSLFHAVDERIPVQGFLSGLECYLTTFEKLVRAD